MIVNQDVLIIGGGVVGAACARAMAQAGRTVRLIERGTRGGEGWPASAGLLAPQVEARADDPLLDLGLAGREYWVEEAEVLRESVGVDVGLNPCGILQLANGELPAEDLRSKVAWQRQQGHLCDWLDTTEVHERWPWVGSSDGALWAPRDGSLDPVRLVEALRKDLVRLGVQIVAPRSIRAAREARHLALAYAVEIAVEEERYRSVAEVARALGLSRARLSQVMRRRWAPAGDQERALGDIDGTQGG